MKRRTDIEATVGLAPAVTTSDEVGVLARGGVGPAPEAAAAVRPAEPSALAGLRDVLGRYRYTFLIVVAVGTVAAGQLAEDLADSPTLEMGPPTFYLRRWALIAGVLYMVVISHVVNATVSRGLPVLRQIVGLDDAAFSRYQRQMAPPSLAGNVLLAALMAILVTLLFGVAGSDLPTTNPVTHRSVYLPTDPLAAAAILGQYVVVGWAGLSLVYTTIRRGRALGRLSHEPITVDVFDPTLVLPFGNIALAVALAPAGVILILLAGFGLPNAWLGWTIVLLSAIATMSALLLPLRGIHRQMQAAKQTALKNLNSLIAKAYAEAIGPEPAPAELAHLTERTNTLIPIRRTVQEMTTWPFRDTVAFGRALLVASSPLIYTALGQLITVLYINPLRP